MAKSSSLFSPIPLGFNRKAIQLSTYFKSDVFKVVSSILLFIFVYLSLVTISLGLAIGSMWAGILLIVYFSKFLGVLIALGLIGSGLMIVAFLLKFLFKTNRVDRSSLIEVKESQQPFLFAIIREIAIETGVTFPKHIYFSPDVNACVFYDSNFLSMFLPIRKNLQIGLGLVNSVNVSELKAIIAHEFGHFSQRSMRLGSYVYNVNKVIYNLLYDNEGYSNSLKVWANVNGYFAFFAQITIKVVIGLQWILRKAYRGINKNYMSLSRHMEFQADEIAASVTGAAPLISSLRRLEVANICYNHLFNYYNKWFSENLRPNNIYPQHHEVMKQFSLDFNIPIEFGLLKIDAHSLAFFNHHRVVVKDQWASHPSTDERERHLSNINSDTEIIDELAWSLFNNPEELQKLMTDKIYEKAVFEERPKEMSLDSFIQYYTHEVEQNSFNKTYKGYFDGRNITKFDPNEVASQAGQLHECVLDSLFNDKICAIPHKLNGLIADIQTLDIIAQGNIGIKTFDFDGLKYNVDEVPQVKEMLKDELRDAELELKSHDEKVFLYFLKKAKDVDKEKEIIESYQILFEVEKEFEIDVHNYRSIMESLNPLYHENLHFEKVHQILNSISQKEHFVKARLKDILSNESYKNYYEACDKEKLGDYINHSRLYFHDSGYDSEALNKLNESLNLFMKIVAERAFRIKKDLLEKQLSY